MAETRPLRRRAPRGAAASILVLYSAVALMMLTVMGYVGGQMWSAKELTSARADAVALAASEAIKRLGPDRFCDDQTLQALLRDFGGRCPVARKVGAGATASYVFEYETAEINVQVPTGLMDLQNVEVQTEVRGQVDHHYLPAEERRPKFVLVLDYSGSMGARFGGGNRTAALKDAVATLMGRGYRIDYGAVIFDNEIMATVPIAQNNERAVLAQVNRFGPSGGTCYHGLATALGMLRNTPNTGYYVLFATDGAPNNGCSDGRGEAVQLWNNDVTIFTLNIGAGGAQRDLLHWLSGPPNRRHNPGYSFEAGNPAQLRETFDRIMGRIPCRAYPDFAQMPDPSRVFVGVEQRNREIMTPTMLPWDDYHQIEERRPDHFDATPYATVNLNPPRNERRYVLVNHTGCAPVIEEDAQLLLRYDRPGLATAR